VRVVPAPTHFELAAVRTPDGGTQIVVKMVAGKKELVGTPTTDELRALRASIGELLNNPGARLPAFPSPDRAGPRRVRLWTPGGA